MNTLDQEVFEQLVTRQAPMQRETRSNHNAPAIYPLPDRPVIPRAPRIQIPVIMTEYNENPLRSDFNPGTPAGQKIFLEKTKPLPDDKRLDMTASNATKILDYLQLKEASIGKIITAIPTQWIAGVASHFKNLLSQSPSITLERIQREAFRRHGTPVAETDPLPALPWIKTDLTPATDAAHKVTFHRRVDSNVVQENIKGLLTAKGWQDLLLEQRSFTFTDSSGEDWYDGPTMCKVLLEQVDPTSAINLEMHRHSIESVKLQAFNNNVTEMVKDIEKHFKVITSNGGAYPAESYRRHIIAALLSGPNEAFNTHFKSIKTDVDACYGFHANITPDQLMRSAKSIYVNAERLGTWNQVDPKDAKILALATEVRELSNAAQRPPTNTPTTGRVVDHGPPGSAKVISGGGEMVEGTKTLKKWRTVNVGPTVKLDGTLYSWCPHHKHSNGFFDGLYYSSHTADTHSEWADNQKKRKKNNKTPGTPTAGTGTPAASSGSLQISDALKNALCTNLCVTEEDLAKIMETVEESKN